MHPQSYIFPIVHLVCTCLSMCFNFIDISSILQIFISIVSHILSALRPLYVWWTSTFTKITYKTIVYLIYFDTSHMSHRALVGESIPHKRSVRTHGLVTHLRPNFIDKDCFCSSKSRGFIIHILRSFPLILMVENSFGLIL